MKATLQTLILALMCLSTFVSAQNKYKFPKQKVIGASLSFTGGLVYGIREVYLADPEVFEIKFGAEPQSFWGSDAWKRKYKDWDGGDRRFDSGMAEWYPFDFQHVSSTLSKSFVVAGTVCIVAGEKRPLKHYLYDFAISFFASSCGSYAGFKLFR